MGFEPLDLCELSSTLKRLPASLTMARIIPQKVLITTAQAYY